MIQAPDELRSVAVGATVNLFVSVGQTSRRLKGTVSETRERGADDEVLEVHVTERPPGGSEIVFWLGVAEEGTYLLPLDGDGESLVYATYRHGGGKTGLYVDGVREVEVSQPPGRGDASAREPNNGNATTGTASTENAATGDDTTGGGAAPDEPPDDDEFQFAGEAGLGGPTPER